MVRKISRIALPAIFFILMTGGCSQETKKTPPPVTGKITSFAEIVAFAPVPLKGYGLVAGLAGTGSAQCPPQIRSYLKQYILVQLPKNSPVSADQLLDSRDSAVVLIEGIMPAAAAKGEHFDLQITPVQGTQTTSFAGGRLYSANLQYNPNAKSVATAQGPVFIDTLSAVTNPTVGYILNGGRVIATYDLSLALLQADFRTANTIRNRINERFGDNTVIAASEGAALIRIPQRYTRQKLRFIAMIKELYINEDPKNESLRTEQLIKDLSNNENGYNAEIALEAVGRTQENKIAAATSSSDPQTRFRAARCLLYLGNDAGLGILRQAAMDRQSPYRIEAIEAIAFGARRGDALTILRQFLADGDLTVRLEAYEQLRQLDDPSISTIRVADDFDIDQVFCQGPKIIYVYRSGSPRIVLFGSPMVANPDIFVESADGSVIVNSPEAHKYVSVIRRFPKRNIMLGPRKSSFEIVDIIRTLSEPSTTESKKPVFLGLSLPYADTIAILSTMCSKGTINADFVAGPMPKINLETPVNPPANVMKSLPKDR